AIDGSKFKAVKTRDKNFTKGKIPSRLAHLAKRYGRLKQEIEKLKAMDKALADAPDGQISLTDPDARAMATSARNSGLVGYSAQCAVGTETHIIVTHDVTNKGFDRDPLSPMAIAAKDALGRDTLHALADKGYFSGVESAACDKAGITVTMPRPETSGHRKKGMYVKADFKYDAARDVHICPTGDALTYRYTREEDGLQVRRYWTNDCQTCPVKSRCTTGTERRVTRWDCEHPFGTIKAWMGTTHFLMRRAKNVRTEMALNVLAYNIKRLLAAMPARKKRKSLPKPGQTVLIGTISTRPRL
ncbi:MAG: transposase, partial [Roseinatronobacter sp.]